ncbi:hypothetical protein V2W45_1522451 [Cenococcum geophilum]
MVRAPALFFAFRLHSKTAYTYLPLFRKKTDRNGTINPSNESKEPQTSESSDAKATFTLSEKIRNQEHIDQYANGYLRLAAFYNSDPDFRVFRQFRTLQNRLLLYRQHKLVVLEKRLFDIDNTNSKKNKYRIQSIRRNKADKQSEREKLINKINCKLKQYDELLDRERNLMSLKKPRTSAYYIKSKTEFLNLADDFVILSGDQDSNFHSALKRFIRKSRIKPLKIRFSDTKQLGMLLDKTKLNYLAIAIAAVVSAVLLIIPICLLFRLIVSEKIRLAIVLLFSFLFHAVISYLTKPDNY